MEIGDGWCIECCYSWRNAVVNEGGAAVELKQVILRKYSQKYLPVVNASKRASFAREYLSSLWRSLPFFYK